MNAPDRAVTESIRWAHSCRSLDDCPDDPPPAQPQPCAWPESMTILGEKCPRRGDRLVLGFALCFQHAGKLRKRVVHDLHRDEWFRVTIALGVREYITRWWDQDAEFLVPRPGPTSVYFARRFQFVKIGYATNVNARMNAISNGSGIIEGMVASPVELLAMIPGGLAEEQRLHDRFRHLHVGGEWFLLNNELKDFIERVKETQL